MRRARIGLIGATLVAPALARAADPDVVLAPGTYTGDQTQTGRVIIRNGQVTLNNGRFTNAPAVIVEDTGSLWVRPGANPLVFPNVLELRGGTVREREETGVNVLRLGSGTSEAEFEGHPINVTRLERNPGATLFIDPSGPLNPATGRAFNISQPPPNLIGPGTGPTRLAVAPWAVAFGSATDRSFVTYDTGRLRPLNPATEYASTFSAAPGANVRLTSDASLAADASVNTLTLNFVRFTLDGELTVESGGLMFNSVTSLSGIIGGSGSLVLPDEGFVHAYRRTGQPTPPPGVFTIDVPISGGMLTKTGESAVWLTQSNTLPGGTTLNEGELRARSAESLGTGPIRFNGGRLTLTNADLIPNDIILQTRVPPPAGFTSIDSSTATVLTGRISGDGLLTLAGSTRLNGNGAETGAYEIRATGLITLNGDLASPDSIVATSTLYGSGVARGVVSATHLVSPGNLSTSPVVGRLAVGTAYFGGSTARLDFDVAGGEAGIGYDQLVVLNALDLDTVFRGNSGVPAELLVRLGFRYTPSPGEQFTIIDNQFGGPVDGFFDTRPEGTVFFDSGGTTPFRITYAGGDGNDVVLTVVPEPGMLALLLSIAAVPILSRARRRA